MRVLFLARLLLLAPLLLLVGCGSSPQRSTIPSLWHPSSNHDLRRPDFVILHHTGSADAARALNTLTDPLHRVSAHYLVVRDGTIYQLVDERARAWHAGASRWGMQTDLNSASLGIELDNDGSEDYPEIQLASLLSLLDDLARRNHIPPGNYLGHGDVAPGRKFDPGSRFPWKRLAERGFGLWCEPPYPETPPDFDPLLGLAALGYDATRPDASLRAFRSHFRGLVSEAPVGVDDAVLIHCLLLRKDVPQTPSEVHEH
ncbi:MAG: N-acetylmuramoyl-L-alanine amidase [Rhodocyclaceae bacterium]|nr:N-acetylmuramoyl-L-alanine amidase [Rhodocyclaceae bacterium]